jgi:cell division septation protein DedD/thioredoxin-related protein
MNVNVSKALRFGALLLFFGLSTPVFSEKIAFINDNLSDALNRASSQGKLIFLDFYANYCSPCKLMEEYTFTDPSVVERMNAAYVPVKVNIENFDGYDLKNQFKVKVLPTLIVLDSKGRLVARYEESMTGSRLASVLEKHDAPSNRRVYAPAPASNTGFSPSYTNNNTYSPNPSPNYSPKPTLTASTTKPINTTAAQPTNTYTTTTRSETKPTSYSNSSAPYKPVPPPSNLNVIERPMKKAGFTIQVGSFASEKNAKTLGDIMRRKLGSGQKVFMLKAESTRGAVYKVFVGNFNSRQQATEYRMQYAFEGFVQDYAGFK